MDNALDPFILYGFVGFFGLCLGSFATALIYRVPRDMPWILSGKESAVARSACPNCRAVLKARDLIPLFSWLSTGGRCRYCKSKIGVFYPAIEIGTACLVCLQLFAWGVTPTFLCIALAVGFMVAAVVIDWKHMILPDSINLALFVLGVAFVLCLWREAGYDVDILINHAAAALLLTSALALTGLLISKWKKRDALGYGDLKFLPAAGLFLGLEALPLYLALSGAVGVICAVIMGAAKGEKPFPFGPALIISLYIHVFLTGLGFDY